MLCLSIFSQQFFCSLLSLVDKKKSNFSGVFKLESVIIYFIKFFMKTLKSFFKSRISIHVVECVRWVCTIEYRVCDMLWYYYPVLILCCKIIHAYSGKVSFWEKK